MLGARALQRGFTLIELMVTIAIAAILLGVAVPQLGHWAKRSAVVNAAESIQNGLRTAQAEAVRRNVQVEFALIGSDAASATAATAASTTTTGWRAWLVRGQQDGALTVFARGEIGRDSPDAVLTSASADFNSLTFTGLGQIRDAKGVGLPAAAVFDIRNTNSDVSRARCVFVSPVGAVKACDPSAAAGGPTACPTTVLNDCPAL
jgi:type IV fimbrial biogenesis protein FimT